MNKTILKSNSVFVAIGQSPAWTTGEDRCRLFSLVQNCNFSISNQRQKLKQLGSQDYSVNDIVQAPSVELSFDYYLSPYLNNEYLLNMLASSSDSIQAFSQIKETNNNFYIVVDPEDGRDGFEKPKSSSITSTSYSGFNVVSFGNCYLNKYSVGFALNQLPVVSVGFEASNMKFDSLTGNYVTIPAINSISGNSLKAGSLNLSGFYQTLESGFITGDPYGRTEYNPPVAMSNNTSFKLEDLQIGGVKLSTSSQPILQDFSINIDLPRTPLYGLGSNYVYGRKLQYPINASVSMNALVSGFASGFLSGMLYNENKYNFNIAFSDSLNSATGYYKIKNAKLDNFNYSIPLNNNMSFSAQFSVEITDSSGFLIDRSVKYSYGPWSGINLIWQALEVNWKMVE
jgi:hypothetical protein